MEKTKVLKPLLILITVFVIGGVIFYLGYNIQETVGEGYPIPYMVASFIFFGLFIVLMVKFSPKFLQREAEVKLEKALKKNEKNILKKSMVLNLDDLGTLFKDKIEYKKITDSIYWMFYKSIWKKSTSYILQIVNNLNLIYEHEGSDDNQEQKNDFTAEEIKALDEAIPRKAKTNNNAICRITINVLDNINEDYLKTAELGIKKYKVLSSTAGYYVPAMLYFMYDKSTNTLYYERQYKKMADPRPVAMKRIYKVIGLSEEN